MVRGELERHAQTHTYAQTQRRQKGENKTETPRRGRNTAETLRKGRAVPLTVTVAECWA